MNEPTDFEGRAVLVTGAARGIGYAIATAFAEAGAHVLLNDRVAAEAESAVVELRKAGGPVTAIAGDVSAEADAERIVARTLETAGRLDVLVNNAGVGRAGALRAQTPDSWRLVLGVNLLGPFLMSRAAADALRDAGSGAIVNIASMAAFGMRQQCSYDASKGGLMSLTRSLALELGMEGVRVNAVAPGYIDTPMLRGHVALEELALRQVRGLPIARLGRSDEVAAAVLWLASTDAAYVTGHTLFVDGGLIRA